MNDGEFINYYHLLCRYLLTFLNGWLWLSSPQALKGTKTQEYANKSGGWDSLKTGIITKKGPVVFKWGSHTSTNYDLCYFVFCISEKYMHSIYSFIGFFLEIFQQRNTPPWQQSHLWLASRIKGQCQPRLVRYILLHESIQRWCFQVEHKSCAPSITLVTRVELEYSVPFRKTKLPKLMEAYQYLLKTLHVKYTLTLLQNINNILSQVRWRKRDCLNYIRIGNLKLDCTS